MTGEIPLDSSKPSVPFGKPQIRDEEIEEVVDTLKSGWLSTGPRVEAFESAFRDYKGARHAVALNSCTAALHLSLLASGIGPGDEVITTPMTFCATVNSILHVGGTPVLADVDPRTMNLDPEKVRQQISSQTRALLPVHMAGRPCNMDELMTIAQKHDLVVIEDCAHAIETEYRGTPAGTMGDFGCFSFYSTKNLVTGEGGMVITDDENYAGTMKTLSLHGMSDDAWKRFEEEGPDTYDVVQAGWKYNMMDIQAALGIHQLDRLEQNWKRRKEIWEQYQESFGELPVKTPANVHPENRHGFHLYTLMIDPDRTGVSRKDFMAALNQQNVGTSVHYRSLPEFTYYQKELGWDPEDYPEAKSIGRQTVSLPLGPNLTDRQVDHVCEAVHDVLR